MNVKILCATTLVAMMAAGSASAATSTFSFSGNGGILGSSSNFMSNTGLSLTATATRQDNSGNPIGGFAALGQYAVGLGVTTSRFDDHQVDSFGHDEAVLFDFGMQEVTLESVTFSLVGTNDDFSFSFFTTDPNNPDTFFQNIALPNGSSIQEYTFINTWTGSLFGIGAGNTPFFEANDEFKIRNLVVSYDVAAVPVPAAAFLFAPALLGFMGLRRKAKQAEA